jgi:hypothetical protein
MELFQLSIPGLGVGSANTSWEGSVGVTTANAGIAKDKITTVLRIIPMGTNPQFFFTVVYSPFLGLL